MTTHIVVISRVVEDNGGLTEQEYTEVDTVFGPFESAADASQWLGFQVWFAESTTLRALITRLDNPEPDDGAYGVDPMDDIPFGTPDSWIPDNPNEDGFTRGDFI